jgi:predicted nucleic acid-binding protein
VVVNQITADRLEQAADLAARQMIGMYDALFVQMARERNLRCPEVSGQPIR